MSNRVPVARIAALPDDTPVAARIAGVDLTVVNHAGRITVCQGRCPHQGTLLAEGTIEKGALVCRGHGWRFDCASGAKIDDPRVCLKHFAVFLTDGVVQVDPQEVVGWQAAQAPVAAAHPHGRPRWIADLPGPKGLPWLGQVLSWKPRQLHLIGERWCREYGPLYSFKLMSRPVVAVAEPQLLTQILRERPERYRRLKVLEAVLHDIGVSGVFSAEGEAWRKQRKLVTPALGPKHLRQFFPALVGVTKRLHKRWEAAARAQRPVDAQHDLMRFTVDVTTGLAFGYDMNTLETEGDAIQQHLEKIFPTITRRISAPFPYWRYFKLPADRAFEHALAEVSRIINQVIADSRKRLAQSGGAPQARNFLEALLLAQAGSDAPLTDAEVLGNVFTMLMAGEDTTANTMAWMLHFMARHPDVQARMQAEADAVLGTAAVLDDIAGAERLAYIEAAAHETMRLKPVAPLLFLEPKEDVQLDGLHVPRGTFLMLLTRPSGLRASGTVSDDAFRPERWLGGPGAADLHHAGFVPFGSGPRLCPGRSLALLEIKTAMSMVCRNFNVAAPARARPVGELFAFTMMPTNLRVVFSRRAEQGSGSSRRERALAANTE